VIGGPVSDGSTTAARNQESHWLRPGREPGVNTTPKTATSIGNSPTGRLFSITKRPPLLSPLEAIYFFEPRILAQSLMMSIGSGNTMVVFLSIPISVKVCKYRS
jgi:hypothetical protein